MYEMEYASSEVEGDLGSELAAVDLVLRRDYVIAQPTLQTKPINRREIWKLWDESSFECFAIKNRNNYWIKWNRRWEWNWWVPEW